MYGYFSSPGHHQVSLILHGLYLFRVQGGARGVMVIIVGNGHGDTSSNPGRD